MYIYIIIIIIIIINVIFLYYHTNVQLVVKHPLSFHI